MTTILPSRGRFAPVGAPGEAPFDVPWRSHAALGQLLTALVALAGALRRRAGGRRALERLSREALLDVGLLNHRPDARGSAERGPTPPAGLW